MNNEEELKYLIEAFSLLRNELKDITQKLNKIEKRISNSFPQYKEIKYVNPTSDENHQVYNREELLKLFEELVDIKRDKDDIALSLKLKAYSTEILVALALELGVPGSKKMGAKKAISGIKGRIQESLMLSSNRRPANGGILP